jgi:hypothetical protein
MAAIGQLADPFARTGLTLLRGTGIPPRRAPRPRAGLRTGLRQPRQRAAGPAGQARHRADRPLDAPTLAALDEWIAQRGPQRALPRPRLSRPADFLFTERGKRPTAWRLRHGLDDAARAAGLRGRDGQALHPTPTRFVTHMRRA